MGFEVSTCVFFVFRFFRMVVEFFFRVFVGIYWVYCGEGFIMGFCFKKRELSLFLFVLFFIENSEKRIVITYL